MKIGNSIRDGFLEIKKLSPALRVGLLAGVLVHVFGFFFFRVISNPLPSPEQNQPFIKYVSGLREITEDGMLEQASLFDSAPLFIPGEWSSSSGILKPRIDSEWEVFPDIPLQVDRQSLLVETRPERLTLPQVAEVTKPMDLLGLQFWDVFESFGQSFNEPLETGEEWRSLAVVRVLSENSGNPPDSSLRLEIDSALAQSAVRPMRFFVTLSAAGLLLGQPVIDQFSGSDIVDQEILQWFLRPETLARLPQGYLEVQVFP